MKESSIVRTFQKISSRLVVFVLVGAMLILLGPMVAGKANAYTGSNVYIGQNICVYGNYVDPRSGITEDLRKGIFVMPPILVFQDDGLNCIRSGPDNTIAANVKWSTIGWPPLGPEFGYVSVHIVYVPPAGPANKFAIAEFGWYNPTKGKNECGIQFFGPDAESFKGTCSITQGNGAEAKFTVQALR